MKDIIKKILNEEYKKMINIPDSTVLSYYNNSLTIIDIDTDQVLGFIGLSEDKNGTYYFPMIAAEKGYGPTILEAALMYSYPKGLMVSRDGDIREGAFELWKKMYLRDDILKETLPLTHERFNFAIVTGDDDDIYDNEFDKLSEFEYYIEEGYKNDIMIYNTKMMMVPSEEYDRLLNLSVLLDHKGIYEQGRDYFSMRYND